MSRSTVRPSRLRATTAKLAVGGAAGLAALLVVAPAALAEDAPTPEPTETTDPGASTPTPDPTDEPTTPGETTDPTEPTPGPTEEPTEGTEPTPAPTTGVPAGALLGAHKTGASRAAEVAEVEPSFGLQKYRVGVQVADGSYVPAGTTTAGTTITITQTNQAGETLGTFTCTTDASTQEPGSTATFCLSDVPSGEARAQAKASGVSVTPGSIPSAQTFVAGPGDTVTITQTTVMPNLVRDTSTATLAPCQPTNGPFCEGQTVLFNDPGLPPIAVDDKATTDEGVAVDIDVLDNDDPVNGAPVSGLTVISDPGDGTADVDNGEITYTPDDGFTGTDTFDYRYSTPNGTASATVTVRVRPQATSPVDDQVLPDTGGAGARLFGSGALLLAAGGWLTVRGRRAGAHAPTD